VDDAATLEQWNGYESEACLTDTDSFLITSLNWSAMRQTLIFRNWIVGIDY
jgi:hypothetical protein